jgi:hypothetical protein
MTPTDQPKPVTFWQHLLTNQAYAPLEIHHKHIASSDITKR